MAMARSMFGRLVTAVVKATVATATVTQTAFTHCLSAVLLRMVMYRGTRKHARQLLLARTAVALELSGRL